jgi:hypothetical protein
VRDVALPRRCSPWRTPESNFVGLSPPDHRCDDQLGIPTPWGCVYESVTPEYLPSWANPMYAASWAYARSASVRPASV